VNVVGERATPIFGPEPWAQRTGVTWSHWDGWFCFVCVADFGGDWEALADEIEARRRGLGGTDAEAKLSHIADLRGRLAAAGLDAHTLAVQLDPDRPVVAKARRKVLDQALAGRDLTPPMIQTPRRRLLARALRGRFDRFPVSPEADADRFGRLCRRVRGGLALAMELERVATAEDVRRASDPARRLALWRGVLTAGREAYEAGLRDSGGVVGGFLGEVFETYAGLRWRIDGFEPVDYYADLVDVVVFEDYGLLHTRETAPWHGVPAADVPLVAQRLVALEEELRCHRLRFHAEEARQHLGYLYAATRTFDRFVSVSAMLGSDHWIPIATLAQVAHDAGNDALALDVFAAATARPGPHREYLIQRCVQLLGWTPSGPRELGLVTNAEAPSLNQHTR